MTQGFNYLGTMPGTVMLSCLILIQLSLDLLDELCPVILKVPVVLPNHAVLHHQHLQVRGACGETQTSGAAL